MGEQQALACDQPSKACDQPLLQGSYRYAVRFFYQLKHSHAIISDLYPYCYLLYYYCHDTKVEGFCCPEGWQLSSSGWSALMGQSASQYNLSILQNMESSAFAALWFTSYL
ncbi:MAG: hypothetical protein KBA53_08355 [Thermoclostridium sp.]|nr:hypothetical protein [Thermoclostridium sp.]